MIYRDLPGGRLYHGDCLEVLQTMPDNSVDAVIIDPNYGMGIDEWDGPVDVSSCVAEAARLSREFFAFFGQMPYCLPWVSECFERGLPFLEHISWVKRIVTPSRRLSRGHESIFVFATGGRRSFYETKGPHEDVKVPGILFDTVSVAAIQRWASALGREAKTGEQQFVPSKTERMDTFSRFDLLRDHRRAALSANFTNVWSFLPANRSDQNKGRKFHPTAKPVQVFKRLTEMLTPESGTVLDFFSGSGTAAVAAINAGRKFVLVEKEEVFFEKAAKRIEAAGTPN